MFNRICPKCGDTYPTTATERAAMCGDCDMDSRGYCRSHTRRNCRLCAVATPRKPVEYAPNTLVVDSSDYGGVWFHNVEEGIDAAALVSWARSAAAEGNAVAAEAVRLMDTRGAICMWSGTTLIVVD